MHVNSYYYRNVHLNQLSTTEPLFFVIIVQFERKFWQKYVKWTRAYNVRSCISTTDRIMRTAVPVDCCCCEWYASPSVKSSYSYKFYAAAVINKTSSPVADGLQQLPVTSCVEEVAGGVEGKAVQTGRLLASTASNTDSLGNPAPV